MKQNWKFFLLAGVVAFFFSCASTAVEDSVNVAQKRIHQWYQVEIDEGSGISKAEAQFRLTDASGTTLRLSDPSNVTVNGETLGGSEPFLRGYVYAKNGAKSEDGTFTFVWTDADGKTFENAVAASPINFKDVPASMNKGDKNMISWDGPIGPGETVTVTLMTSGPDGTPHTSIQMSSQEGATSLSLGTLDSSHPGQGTLRITRKSSKDVQQSTEVGGTISGVYKGKSAMVEITGPPVQTAPAQGAPDAPVEDGAAAPDAG